MVSPCFCPKTFLWAKKTPAFSGRSDNSLKSRKALSGCKRKFEEAVLLQVPSTSDVPGQLFLSVRFTDRWFKSSVQKCGHQSGISLYLRTVVTPWGYCSRGKWRIDYQNDQSSLFRSSQAYLSWSVHNVFKCAVYWKSHWKCLVKYQLILWLISSTNQRDEGGILAVFHCRYTVGPNHPKGNYQSVGILVNLE